MCICIYLSMRVWFVSPNATCVLYRGISVYRSTAIYGISLVWLAVCTGSNFTQVKPCTHVRTFRREMCDDRLLLEQTGVNPALHVKGLQCEAFKSC